MRDDAVTESITHFIGIFALSEEQSRLRLEYDRFKSVKATEEEQALLDASSRSHKSPLMPEGYEPELQFKSVLAPLPHLPDAPVQPLDLLPPALPVAVPPLPPVAPAPPGAGGPSGGDTVFNLPVPSSMMGVVVQTNVLSDVDVVGGTRADATALKSLTEARLVTAQDLAEVLTPVHLPMQSIDGDWSEIVGTVVQSAAQLHAAVAHLDGAVTATAATGEITTNVVVGEGVLEMTTATGAAAQGIHVNGVAVDELPEWQDYLPVYLSPEDEEDEAGADEGASPAEHDYAQDFQGSPPVPQMDPDEGHHIITGGNQLINETTIQSTWLDAKVFVVGGDYFRFDGIFQTNVIVEADSVSGLVAGQHEDAGSASHNLARIEMISRAEHEAREEAAAQAAEEDDDTAAEVDTGEAASADGAVTGADVSFSSTSQATNGTSTTIDTTVGAQPDAGPAAGPEPDATPVAEPAPEPAPHFNPPSNWAVVTIKGDLIQTNWSQQTNFVNESDWISYSFSASTTSLSTGENLAINDFNAWELGFQYDLIIVGGNMIDVTIVSQTNVLLDDDRLEVTASASGQGGKTAESVKTGPSPEATAQAVTAAKVDTATTAASTQPAKTETAATPAAEATQVHAATATAGPAAEAKATPAAEATAGPAVAAKTATASEATVASQVAHGKAGAESAAPAAGPASNQAIKPADAAPSDTQASGKAQTASSAEVTAKAAPAPAAQAEAKAATVAPQPDTATTGVSAAPASTPGPVKTKTEAPDHPAQIATAPTTAAGEVKASLSDNMLVNKAEITTIGKDVQAEMDKAYAKTLDNFQHQREQLAFDVMTKSEFAGTDVLRVLYIEKDFKTVNVVQQNNVLGDEDTVQLAIDEFAAGLNESMKVTMGSNALANLASVRDSGLDSTIMAQGEGYSDALLHQADFVMADMPDMSGMQTMKDSLASEAVAFLSDGMIDAAKPEMMKAEMSDAFPSADLMQTMLT